MRIGTLKETYIADAALFDSRTQKVWLAVGAALLVLFPFMASDYWLYLACLVSINVASATGLNILTGYTGLVSLGQAAFMGLGAYTVAVLETKVGTPFVLNLLAAGFVAMLGGIVVGIPSLRVKGLYLAIATIAASFIAHFIFANWKFTGGTGGLSVPPAKLFGMALDTSFRALDIGKDEADIIIKNTGAKIGDQLTAALAAHLEYKLAEARALEASSSTSARVSQLSAAGISIVGFVVVLLIGLFTIRGIVGADRKSVV